MRNTVTELKCYCLRLTNYSCCSTLYAYGYCVIFFLIGKDKVFNSSWHSLVLATEITVASVFYDRNLANYCIGVG